MAIMYLAKINLTEGIFDVYDNKLNLDDVKQTIYDELDEKKTFSTSSSYKYRDSYGNTRRMPQLSKYSVKELTKSDNGVITENWLEHLISQQKELMNMVKYYKVHMKKPLAYTFIWIQNKK